MKSFRTCGLNHLAVTISEMKAHIQGVASQTKTFNYFYEISLGNLILQHSDNLSRTLQKVDILAAEGQEVASMTLQTLKSLRSDANFKLFWTKVTRLADKIEVSKLCLPRHKKVPRRLDDRWQCKHRLFSNPRISLQVYLLSGIGSDHHEHHQ